MNFRLVWIGSDDDPGDINQPLNPAIPHSSNGELPRYAQRGTEIVRQEIRPDGRLRTTPVANFYARIVGDLIIDDGVQERRELALEAIVGGNKAAISVSAAEFGRMSWSMNRLGPQAIIYPGQLQHARAAIQMLSGEIPQERVFAHIGWRKNNGQWVYLHGGGALGGNGPVSGLHVELPAALRPYRVELPHGGAERVHAVTASLRFLGVAPDRISIPLLAGVYAAAQGTRGFSLFLAGQSGVFKTALAALCQQHFGADMNASRLPANFASTANSLEALAYHAKDALLVTDDFAPRGVRGDQGLQLVAERLFRGAGNQQGRSRMNQNGRVNQSQASRALVLGTGEEVPQGHSIRARLVIIDISRGDVDRTALTDCQQAAQRGEFAASMGSFIAWMAGRYDAVQQHLRSRVQEIVNQSCGPAIHARLPMALAQLQASFEVFLEFAHEIGAIGNDERGDLLQRTARAWNELIATNAKHDQSSDPASRFLILLRAALSAGRAHLSGRDGKAPPEPAAWGWQRKSPGRGWVPQGVGIGWIAGPYIYLDPSASYQVAQLLAGNEPLLLSEQTLRQRLKERHLLVSIDPGRQMLLVRRTLAGRPRQVLHLKTSDLERPALSLTYIDS